MSVRRILIVVAVVVIFLCPEIGAETTGCVLTADGHSVAGAEIRIVVAETVVERYRRLASGAARKVIERTQSDDAGRFALSAESDGRHEIHTVADGFAPKVVLPGTVGEIGVVVKAAPAVEGRVTTEEGRPVPGAVVIWSGGDGEVSTAVTDESGGYSVPDPAVWANQAEVFHPAFGASAPRIHTRGFSPTAEDRADVEVRSAEFVSGTVVDGSGEPVEGAIVTVAWRPMSVTDADGRFALRAVSGASVIATHGDRIARSSVDSRDLTLTVEPGRFIEGRVINPDGGGGVPHARVFVWDSTGFQAPVDVLADATGRFEIGPLPASDYRVGTRAASAGWSMAYEEANLKRVDRLDLVLRLERGGTVSGRVTDSDGSPVAGAVVLRLGEMDPLILGHSRNFGGQVGFTGCDGRFELPAPDDGEKYRVAAVKKGLAPAVSAWIEDSAGASPVRLTLTEGRPVEGRVVGADGNPVSGVAIAVMGRSSMIAAVPPGQFFDPTVGVEWFYRTSADGSFTIPLSEETWYLAFGKEGFVPILHPAIVVGETGPLEITLSRARLLQGRVVSTDGTPLEGIDVAVNADVAFSAKAVSGIGGDFEIEVAAAGRYVLMAFDAATGRRASIPVEVPGPLVTIELPATRRVAGRVVDGDTGKGVAGARISPEMVGRSSEFYDFDETDLDGVFSFEAFEVGRYLVNVAAEGYLPPEPVEVSVGPAAATEEITVTVFRGVRAGGRVRDDNGDPVEGAQVRAVRVSDLGEEITLRGETDSDGIFDIGGLASGAVEISVRTEGYVPAHRTLELEGDVLDLVIELDRGEALSGRVLDSDGSPLPGADVVAEAGGEPGQYLRDRADEDGVFALDGMSPGPWEIRATRNGYEDARVDDVDPGSGDPLTIVLREWPSGTVVGTVEGVPEGALVSIAVWHDRGRSGRGADAKMESDGSYKVDKAPAGTVRVTAYERSYRESRERTATAEVPDGGEVRVDFDFREGSELSGRVTRHGEPVVGAFVSVSSEALGGADAVTDGGGGFSCRLQDGVYDLEVFAMDGRKREIEVEISGPTTRDIDLGGAVLAGWVVDGETGGPIGGADVDVELRSDTGAEVGSEDLKTDSTGRFRFEDLPPGRHQVRVAHPSYAQHRRDVELAIGAAGEIEVVLEKAEGMRVLLVDRRTGAPLSGTVVARNMDDEVVFDGTPRRDGKGVRLILPPGSYKVSASASDYATHTEIASAPSDEVVVGLTPGGTLIVRSEEQSPRQAKLIMPSGEEYIRCWCNRIAEVNLEGGITGIENIAAGSYDLVVSERDDSVSSYPVTVVEGQATEVLIR